MNGVLAAWIQTVGKEHSVQLFGVKLVGINADNGWKLLLTVGFIVAVLLLNWLLRQALRLGFQGLARTGEGLNEHRRRRGLSERIIFWIHQAIRLLLAIALLVGVISIWFNEPSRLATFLGLVTAGVAFALQRVITAFAGYFVILRGKTFNVGDRIVMGGVRGDVSALGFMQTTIMEMGQPPSVQSADPAMWVRARQYTGRICTVTNDKIFDEPVYNYTRDFPYIWEELMLPIDYKDDRRAAEQILLDAVRKHSIKLEDLNEDAIQEMERRYVMPRADIHPRVYWRLTDNWLELTARFLTADHGVRDAKDAMARDILAALDAAGIGIASSTYNIVGMPPLRVTTTTPTNGDGQRDQRPSRDDQHAGAAPGR